MLNEIEIRNFRSIKELSFKPGVMNGLVGPNNVGKSNVLRAINVVLGPKWPPYAVSPEDKNKDAPNDPLEITLRFDKPLRKDYYGTPYDVHGLKLRYEAPDDSDFSCLEDDGTPFEIGPYRNPLRVDNTIRAQLPCLLVEAQRDLAAELRAGEWTFLGRILRDIKDELQTQAPFGAEFSRRSSDFSAHLMQQPVKDLERMLNEEMSAISGFHELQLSFEPPDLLTSLKAVRIHVREAPDLPPSEADELGQGLQSSLVVALVRAYQRLRHVNPVLLLEEPEAFLHPQARRAFYSLLEKTSKQCQIFYSTHAGEFLDITRPEQIALVRKHRTEGTTIVQGDRTLLSPGEQSELKVACEVDEKMREALFSHCAIACEGDSESASIPLILRRAGMDPDRAGWTVVSAGSKTNLPFVIRLYRHFAIPTVAVFDTDSDKGDFATRQKDLNAQIEALVGGNDRCWIADPDFEAANAIPIGESKRRGAVRWSRALTEENAKRIVAPLLKAVEVATRPSSGRAAVQAPTVVVVNGNGI